MDQQTPEAMIAGYQQLLGATHYRTAMAESAAQQLAASNQQLTARNQELEAELAKLKKPAEPPKHAEE